MLPFVGRPAGAKRTQRVSRPRGMSSEIDLIAMPTPCCRRKAEFGAPLGEVCSGSPESLARGMLTKGFPVNPGELPASPQAGPGAAQPKDTRSPGGEGCLREKRMTLKRSLLRPRETGGAGTGRRAVLRFHSTDEGGEPQGSRKGRPRYPLEGSRSDASCSSCGCKSRRWRVPRCHRSYTRQREG